MTTEKINSTFDNAANLGGDASIGVSFDAARLNLPVPLAQLQRDADIPGNVKSFGNASLAASVVNLANVARIDSNAPPPRPAPANNRQLNA